MPSSASRAPGRPALRHVDGHDLRRRTRRTRPRRPRDDAASATASCVLPRADAAAAALPRSVEAPIDSWSKASVSPSHGQGVDGPRSPYVQPGASRAAGAGAWLIDSWPPATTTSASSRRIIRAASMIAVRPLRQTLLTVVAGTRHGMPGAVAACRAGFWPAPACTHLAHDHVVDRLGRHARPGSSAPRIAAPPAGRRSATTARRSAAPSASARRTPGRPRVRSDPSSRPFTRTSFAPSLRSSQPISGTSPPPAAAAGGRRRSPPRRPRP